MPVTNGGLGRDSLLEMVHNPGGDWNPGWRGSSKVYRIYMMTTVEYILYFHAAITPRDV